MSFDHFDLPILVVKEAVSSYAAPFARLDRV